MPDAGRQGGRPRRNGRCWPTSRRKDNRACISRAIQPLRGLDGAGTRVQEDEGRGSTRGCGSDWPRRGDSGKPNHTFEAYHHAQRRLGTARDMDDPWLDVRPSPAQASEWI